MFSGSPSKQKVMFVVSSGGKYTWKCKCCTILTYKTSCVEERENGI